MQNVSRQMIHVTNRNQRERVMHMYMYIYVRAYVYAYVDILYSTTNADVPPSNWNTFSTPLFLMKADALSHRTPAVQYINT
jgi:hypothetical protein